MMIQEILSCLNKVSLARYRQRVEKPYGVCFLFYTIFSIGFGIFDPKAVRASNSGELISKPPVAPLAGEPTYEEGKLLLDKHKWAEAAVHFRLLSKRDPKSIPVVIGLTTALLHTARREEALDLLIQTVPLVKGPQQELLKRRINVISRQFLTNRTFQLYQDGLNLISGGKKFKAAKEKFEKASAEEPENVEILVRLGQCLSLENEIESSLERFKMAKRFNPFESEIQLFLGRVLHLHGDKEEAVKELRSVHLDLPQFEIATVWYAEALASTGNSNAAIRILDTDAKASPFHISSLMTAAKLRAQNPHADTQTLWSARKQLQLVISRFASRTTDLADVPNPSKPNDSMRLQGGFLLTQEPSVDMKAEAQKLLQQIQARLDHR